MKFEYQDDIDRFLKERMTEAEQEDFKRQMERNAELRDQTDFTDKVRRAAISRNEKLDAMGDWDVKPVATTNMALLLCHTQYHICLA